MVELMIALTTGLFITGGIIQVFLGMRQASRLESQQAHLQESMRFASDLLGNQFRMAGFWGCADPNDTNFTFTNHVISLGLFDPVGSGTLSPVFGVDSDGTATNMTNPWGGAPDSITIAGALTPSMMINTDVSGTTAIDVNVIAPNELSSTACSLSNTVMITDCAKGDLFHVTNDPTAADWQRDTSCSIAGGGSTNTSEASLGTYEALDSMVVVVREHQFAVRDLSGGPHLARSANGGNFDALIPGVVDMQIEYGVDSTGADAIVDHYLTAAEVNAGGQWNRVMSIRIALLLRSEEDNLVAVPQTFYYIDASDDQWKNMTAPIGDRHRYRTLIKTIALRARID